MVKNTDLGWNLAFSSEMYRGNFLTEKNGVWKFFGKDKTIIKIEKWKNGYKI